MKKADTFSLLVYFMKFQVLAVLLPDCYIVFSNLVRICCGSTDCNVHARSERRLISIRCQKECVESKLDGQADSHRDYSPIRT